jgi:hypothetical protein
LFLFVSTFSVKAGNVETRKGGDPPFICKEVSQPKTSNEDEVKKGVLSFWPKQKYYGGVEDNQKTLVVFVAFSDQTVSNDNSEKEKEAKESLFAGEKSVSNYFWEVSGKKMQKITGDVLSGWIKLSKTSEEYGVDNSETFIPKDVFDDAKSAIDNAAELSEFARIVIFMEGNHGFAMATAGQWVIENNDGELSLSICWFWSDDISDQYKLRHEFFHTLGEGIGHSSSLILGNDDSCNRLCSDIIKGENTK